ncbi:hypothetical protein [Sulfurimonas sp.]|uniref:hypothetical protein n=1 Tax=Sulfurimonas sp. TaxID=2022749 RepID=UPI00356326A4
MFKKILMSLLATLFITASGYAKDADAFDIYEWMESLRGEWVLSPADKQIGTNSYKNKYVLPMVGTDKTGIAFKSIGRNSTIQEDLLPNSPKQMVTMYHCKDIKCEQIKATHYCVKQNQPEFIANFKKSTPTKIVFDCDMSTEICQSNEDHVHTIIHEITNDGKHLKTSYLSWENKKPKTNSSIYHFDRR